MSQKYWCAKRDELGTVYEGKTMKVDAASVVEAAMAFFRVTGEFPTEVEWMPEQGEGVGGLHVGMQGSQYLRDKVKVLENESLQLQEVIENQRNTVLRLDNALKREREVAKLANHHYHKLHKYVKSWAEGIVEEGVRVHEGYMNALNEAERKEHLNE